MANDITIQLDRIFDEYVAEVEETVAETVRKISRITTRKLRAVSPKDTGSYSKGWRVELETGAGSTHIKTAIIHNKTDWQLTHLLEGGHIIKNQFGKYGRVQARPHIAHEREAAYNSFYEEIRRALG